MSRITNLRALIDELDMIEWRIEAERTRYRGWVAPVVALIATGDAGRLDDYRASRRRVRALERERERLLGLSDPPRTRRL